MTHLIPADATADEGTTNSERASWAEAALIAFCKQTGVISSSLGDKEEALLIVADLLADLAHWCDRNHVDLPSALMHAARRYQAETGGQGGQLRP
ncbi:MAG TPA: hypothetical protein VGQ12_15970 [Candidatus Angelobacter sp.]|jgi:hypothetical protein|nr:hypothetical protein [Candidatus Angelobacter sp.]